MEIKGIDVSAWQEKINWSKVKASGIKFAILRCGWGQDVAKQDDAYFAANVKGCEDNGIAWGVYLYSYADSTDKAKSELAHILRLLKGKKPTYPIYYDLEDAATTGKCSKSTILAMAKIVVEGLEKAGYWAGIYANLNWFTNYLTDGWYNTKAIWIAQYAGKCTYKKAYGIWQYSSSGKVDGINGNVDMNVCYVDYPSKIKAAGLNGWTASTAPIKKTTAPKGNVNKTLTVDAPATINGTGETGSLDKGDKNRAVYAYKQLLILLHNVGVITQNVDNNNVFGDGTETATKQLQEAAGLEQDGKAGPLTIRAAYLLLKGKLNK